MKLWHLAAILLVLGIGYVLIARPTVAPSSTAQASVSNSIFGLLTAGVNLASRAVGKATPNSAIPPDNSGYSPGLSVSGNTIVNQAGQTQTFGPPDSSGPDPSVNQ